MEWSPLPEMASRCQSGSSIYNHLKKGTTEMKLTTIGIDLAKNVLQATRAALVARLCLSEQRLRAIGFPT